MRCAPCICALANGSAKEQLHSGIIHDFTVKSNSFLSLGACRLKKRIVALVLGLGAILSLIACGGSSAPKTRSGLPERVLASQGISATLTFGGLVIVDGQNDTLPRAASLPAGTSPGLIVVSPTRDLAATFDVGTNTVFAVDTANESPLGNGIRLPGPSNSIVLPTASPAGFAAVPSATVNGFSFVGAVEALSFATGSLSTIAVSSAETVVSNSNGTQLLVFAADSDIVTVVNPVSAVPPVDTSCVDASPNPSVCTLIADPRLSRPVNAIVNGTTAYILNCGLQCGGAQPASVAVFDLGSLKITQTIPVDAARMALLSGSTLYVAGTSPLTTNNDCTGQMWGTPPQQTAATICGRLDVVDLTSGTVTATAKITDGYHDRMDLTNNGQLFIGSYGCTNIGDVNNPSGEVRGCLSIYKIADGSVLIPPDNGDVGGLQGFTTRYVEYVAEGGQLRVYDTTKDILLINDFVPLGTIDIIGYVGDVKAIDFF